MPPWNPWADLGSRAHVTLAIRPLPGPVRGVYHRRGSRAVIVLASALGRRARNATLAHELVHDERGGGAAFAGQPASWEPVVARDERRVDDEVARRLVPGGELDSLWRRARGVDGCLGPREVAAAFDVPLDVATRALELRRPTRRHPRRSGR